MKRFVFWFQMILICSVILTVPMSGDVMLGVGVEDTFQLTFEYNGKKNGTFTLPHTTIAIFDMTQPVIVDYQIKEIIQYSDFSQDIVLYLKSEWITQDNYEITPSLQLIKSYEISNGSYFQPPPILSLDFESQFVNLVSYVNNRVNINNNTVLLESGYNDSTNFFEFYIIANHTYTSESMAFQESTITYNKETGILEEYQGIIIWDGYQGIYSEELSIINSSYTTSSSNDNYILINLIFLLLILTGGYLIYVFKLKSKNSGVELVDQNISRKTRTLVQYEATTHKKSIEESKPKVVKMIMCPSCNTANELTSIYCLECGIYIAD